MAHWAVLDMLVVCPKAKKEQWKDIVKIFENSTHGADTERPHLPGCHVDHTEELSDKKEYRMQLFGECRYSITGTLLTRRRPPTQSKSPYRVW